MSNDFKSRTIRVRGPASRLGVKGKLKGGGVCFWQYFNSRLQVAPHLHLVVPEALWTEQGQLVEVPGPSDDDVMAILQRISHGELQCLPM